MRQLRIPRNLGRLLIVFLLVAIALIVFKFLQPDTKSVPEPVTLSFAVANDEYKHWQPLIEQFHDKYKDIKIKLETPNQDGTDELKNIYTDAFNKSQPFDLIYMDIIWVPEFAQNVWLMDLSEKFSRKELEQEFLVSEVYNGYYNDKLYRIPFRTDAGVLYYRKDLLKKAGNPPPETFDNLIEISQNLQKENNLEAGYLWQGQQSESIVAMFVEVLEGYGGFWIDKDNKVGLRNQEAIQAVKFLRSTIKQGISPKGITTEQEEDSKNRFQRGQAVFMRNWPAAWTDANKPKSNVLGKIGIKPMVHAPGKKSGACKGGWGFGIAKNSEHKEEALQAIKFFTSAAIQRQFTLAYGSPPSRRKLFFEPKIVAKYSHYPDLLDLIDGTQKQTTWVARPRIPKYADASSILQKHLSAALNLNENGDFSLHDEMIKDEMNAAAEETKQLL
jgi:multiple sugar transport system substrate-binding protein